MSKSSLFSNLSNFAIFILYHYCALVCIFLKQHLQFTGRTCYTICHFIQYYYSVTLISIFRNLEVFHITTKINNSKIAKHKISWIYMGWKNLNYHSNYSGSKTTPSMYESFTIIQSNLLIQNFTFFLTPEKLYLLLKIILLNL